MPANRALEALKYAKGCLDEISSCFYRGKINDADFAKDWCAELIKVATVLKAEAKKAAAKGY